MQPERKKYRFALINAFVLPKELALHGRTPCADRRSQGVADHEFRERQARARRRRVGTSTPERPATYGNWPVLTREEFALAAVARVPLVRQACESGKYNAIVLLGGGEPGFLEFDRGGPPV